MESDFWYSQKMDNEVINLTKIERFFENNMYLREYIEKHLDEGSYVFIAKCVTDQIDNIMARQPSEPAPDTNTGC